MPDSDAIDRRDTADQKSAERAHVEDEQLDVDKEPTDAHRTQGRDGSGAPVAGSPTPDETS